MPVALLSTIMKLLQNNSTEKSITQALNFICESCSTELNCEKVDLFVVSTGEAERSDSKCTHNLPTQLTTSYSSLRSSPFAPRPPTTATSTMVPMCQVVNPYSALGEKIANTIPLNENDVEFLPAFRSFFSEMYESKLFKIEKGNIWDRITKGKEAVFSSDDDPAELLLGDDFMGAVKSFTYLDLNIKNVMAVPVHCTRNNDHLVAVILCQNKIEEIDLDSDSDSNSVSASSDRDLGRMRSARTSLDLASLDLASLDISANFSDPSDAVIPKQLSQFMGIALSSLEMSIESKGREEKFQCLIKTIDRLSSDEDIGIQIRHLYLEINNLVMSDDLTLYVSVRNGSALKIVHSTSSVTGIVPIDNKTLVGIVANTKKPVYVTKSAHPSAKNKFGAKSYFTKLLNEDDYAVICVPVIYNDEVSAVIKATNHKHQLDKDDLDILTMLGNSTGILLHQSHILSDAMSAARLAKSAARLAKSASSNFSTLHEIMETVKFDAKILIPAQRVTVYFSDFNRNELWTVLEEMKSKNLNDVFRLPLGKGLAGSCAVNNEVLVTHDAYNEDCFNRDVDATTGFRTKSVLCIPIHERGEGKDVVGVLQIINRVDSESSVVQFSESDMIILQNYAATVGAVLTSKLHDFMNKKLEADAIHSPKDNNTRNILSLNREYTIRDGDLLNDKHHAFKKSSMTLLRRASGLQLEAGDFPTNIDSTAVSTSIGGTIKVVDLPELTRHGITSWNFDVLSFTLEQCQAYIMHMLDQFGLIDELELDSGKTGNFVHIALKSYNDIAYHNYHHATQVAHQTGWMLLRSGINDLAALGMVLAAICHDMGHPGNNNSYEIQTDSSLARLYSDDRVLERHHSALALNILHRDDASMLSSMDKHDKGKVRQLMVNAILSTDMAIHTDLLSNLEGMDSGIFDIGDDGGLKNTKLLHALSSMMIHTADLSTNCLTLEQAVIWGDMCLTEFGRQARMEKDAGVTVTDFMASLDTEKDKAKVQYGFCNYVVKPWFKIVAGFNMFKVDMQVCLKNLDAVVQHYEGLMGSG